MEQNPQILKKTAAALDALSQTVTELEKTADSAFENKNKHLEMLRSKIKSQAARIDEIIKNLNGVIK